MQYVNNGSSNAGSANTNDNTSSTGKTGTVYASGLNIRAGAGKGYGVVGSLNRGDRVTILEQTTAEGIVWGRIATGWIALEYVSLD